MFFFSPLFSKRKKNFLSMVRFKPDLSLFSTLYQQIQRISEGFGSLLRIPVKTDYNRRISPVEIRGSQIKAKSFVIFVYHGDKKQMNKQKQ